MFKSFFVDKNTNLMPAVLGNFNLLGRRLWGRLGESDGENTIIHRRFYFPALK